MGTSCSKRRKHAFETPPVVTAKATEYRFISLLRYLKQLLFVMFLALGASSAFATDPSHVSFTLEGCRNDGTITLPNGSGQFICPDNVYTTGNLGKGWNELDLVPYRVTASTGSSSPSNQTYTIAVVADNMSAGNPGYDVISVPVLNTNLSSSSCTAPSVGPQTAQTPGLGGIDTSIYRAVTITQAQNTTCVYDYYARLALGSHLFPGSSLHSDLALLTTSNTLTTSGIGARDVSIPVKEILPQQLAKTMTAAENGSVTWNLSKSASPANASFGNVCLNGAPQPQAVIVTVTWTKLAVTASGITATANITATNPASRSITVDVTDKIYQGTTQTTLLNTHDFGPFVVTANNSHTFTETVNLPATAGNVGDFLNDVATATYIDVATGIPVPGQTSAQAQAQIVQGSVAGSTATITDSESITGDGLTFAVGTPSVGSFTGGYVAGTQTVGPVGWTSGAQSGSGSVSFNKTIDLSGKLITSGALTDTAHLVTSDGTFSTSAGPVTVGISSSAAVDLLVQKTIPAFLATGEKIVVPFHITGTSATNYVNDVTLTFTGGGATTQSQDLPGLMPDVYTVMEGQTLFFAAGSNTGQPINFGDPSGATRTVDLTVTPAAANCSGIANYNNQPLAGPPVVQVQKITFPALTSSDPDFTWTFTLTGPGLPPGGVSTTANAGAGFVTFNTPALVDGTYTITETQKTGWDLNSAVPNNGTTTTVCTFTISPATSQYQCTFTNTKRGKAQVVKTQSGAALTGTESFTFELRQGASTTQAGTILETEIANAANNGTFTFTTLLLPGATYQLCEDVMPGWMTSLSTFFVVFNPSGDNGVVCTNFTVTPGQTVTFNVDNTPPPGGMARTIGFWKNWSSCKQSNGKQAPVLDQTLALATPPGIQVGTLFLTGVTGQNSPDCSIAVDILNKSTSSGTKAAGNPLYSLAAQLLGAELNIVAGAATCPKVNSAITQANALLVKYGFNDVTVPSVSKTDATLANSLAAELDAYNNNLPSACQ